MAARVSGPKTPSSGPGSYPSRCSASWICRRSAADMAASAGRAGEGGADGAFAVTAGEDAAAKLTARLRSGQAVPEGLAALSVARPMTLEDVSVVERGGVAGAGCCDDGAGGRAAGISAIEAGVGAGALPCAPMRPLWTPPWAPGRAQVAAPRALLSMTGLRARRRRSFPAGLIDSATPDGPPSLNSETRGQQSARADRYSHPQTGPPPSLHPHGIRPSATAQFRRWRPRKRSDKSAIWHSEVCGRSQPAIRNADAVASGRSVRGCRWRGMVGPSSRATSLISGYRGAGRGGAR